MAVHPDRPAGRIPSRARPRAPARASGARVTRPMALHPGIGTPVVDRLGPRDVPQAPSFPPADPVLNVSPIALVLRDALARPHDQWWGARRDGRLTALLYVGAHSGAVLPAGGDLDAHRALGRWALEDRPADPPLGTPAPLHPARLQV